MKTQTSVDISNPLLCWIYSQLNFTGFRNDCKIYLTSLELYILASLVSAIELCKPKDNKLLCWYVPSFAFIQALYLKVNCTLMMLAYDAFTACVLTNITVSI